LEAASLSNNHSSAWLLSQPILVRGKILSSLVSPDKPAVEKQISGDRTEKKPWF